jgi:hypothetical protein
VAVPPVERLICRFAAEPPQAEAPQGTWATALQAEFLSAALRIDAEGADLGEAGPLRWYPDRTWGGRCYIPVTSRTTTGLDLFGYVSFAPSDDGDSAGTDLAAFADFTDETAEANPEWQLDLCEEVIGGWRGEGNRVAAMTLVWGVPIVRGGYVATGELAGLAVDQCTLLEGRFTLLAPDDYREDYLEVALYDSRGEELARESLYEE